MKRILVTGTHRAGTTWVGRMLSSDPQVTYVHEPFNIELCEEQFRLSVPYWFTHVPDLPDPDGFLREYERVLTFRAHPRPPRDETVLRTVRRNIGEHLRTWRLSREQTAVLVKDPIALLSAEILAERFDMGVVCMIRHPLAFSGSLKKWKWAFPFSHFVAQPKLLQTFFSPYRDEIERCASEPPLLVDQAILLWNLFHTVIREYQERHPNWVFLRHEDVTRSPLEHYRATFSSLGLPFTPACEAEITKSVEEGDGETTRTDYQPRNQSEVLNTWGSRLDPDEVERVLAGTAELRMHFYPNEDSPGAQ